MVRRQNKGSGGRGLQGLWLLQSLGVLRSISLASVEGSGRGSPGPTCFTLYMWPGWCNGPQLNSPVKYKGNLSLRRGEMV